MPDTTTKTRQKRQPTPEELGLFDEPEAPPAPPPARVNAQRQPTPEELGFGDDEEEAAPPSGRQPTPEELGMPVRPQGPPPPARDDSWQSWWDWSASQVEDAGESAEEGITWMFDGIRESLGLADATKPYPQDTSRRVPHENMTESSGIFEWLVDYAIPDPVWDFLTGERTQKNLRVGADQTMASLVTPMAKGLIKTGAAIERGLDSAGIDLDYWERSDEEKEALWQDTLAWWDTQGTHFGERAAENRLPEDKRNILDALTEMAPMIPVMLVEYGTAGAVLGNVGGFAAIDALLAAGNDESPDNILFAAIKGAAMGKALDWANILSRPLRSVTLAAAGGGMAAAEGASDVDIMANAIVFPVLGLPAKSGPMGVKYFKEHGIMPDLRDLGGHARDMLTGGNDIAAKKESEAADHSLKLVRSRHAIESTEEALQWQSDLAKAREPQPGDTPEAVDTRVAAANEAHELRMEEYSKKHYEEELPHRQRADHAKRRYDRAMHPYTMSWMEAPYMRALHSHERGVVVAHTQGIKDLQKSQEENDERFAYGMARAEEIRKQAAEEADPQMRRKLETLADHTEDETLRIIYTRKNDAEELAEYRIELAEAHASAARYDLAKIVGRRNKVDGRRALQSATDRDLQDAYRAGLRKVTRSNRRARELLRRGDDYVARIDKRLRDDGITPDNPETSKTYDRVMEEAHTVRDGYRDTAAMELYAGQSGADMRITYATYAHDAAMNPVSKPGLIEWIMHILGLKKMKMVEEYEPSADTSPKDAKKPDKPGWDELPADDYKLPPNFEQRYKALMIHGTKDPHLGGIQNDVDMALNMIADPRQVFPAIAYIAEKHGYDPKSRRGKQTAQLRRDAAEKLGMTSDEFLDTPHGRAFNDAELEAIIMIVDRQWARVQKAYKIWRQTGSNNAFMAYQAELYRFMMIWERVRGAAAEAGRSLRMFREFKGRYGQVGRRGGMSDIEMKMIMDGDGAHAMKMVEARNKPGGGGFFHMLMEYYINALLSGPQTALVNILSGVQMVFYGGIIKPFFAASVGLVRKAADWVLFKPGRRIISKMIRGLIKTFGSEKARKNIEIREQTGKYDGIDGNDIRWDHAHRVRFGEVGARSRGIIESIIPATFQFFRTFFTGERYLGEANFGKGMGEFIPWWLGGTIIRLPGRLLQAIDDFFKVIMYRSGIRGHAYRLAMAEYTYSAQGWKDLRGRRQRYKELVKTPTAYIMHLARKEALEATFQQPLAEGFRGIDIALQTTPALKFLVPFTRTLLNSIEMILSGTPAFVLFKRARDAVMGRYGRAEQDMAIAHILFTTGTTYALFLWALGGNIQAGYPKDEKGRTIQGISGVPPLSARLPGSDHWIQINRVDPMGALISLASSASAAWKLSKIEGDEEGAEQAWNVLFASVFSMITDRSGFKGLLDFSEAASGGQSGTDYDAWSRWANKTMAAIVVPNVVASWARTKDPVLRRADSLLDAIKNRTNRRVELPPVRNLWGDMIIGYDSYGDNDILDYIMPVYWGKKANDPATKVIMDLWDIYKWAPGQLDRKIAGRKLTPQEYDYYQMTVGKRAHAAITAIAASPEWKEAQVLDAQKKALRKKIFREKDPKAQKALKRQYDDVSAKLSKLRYELLQRVKTSVSKARTEGRYDVTGTSDGKRKGAFPDFWERQRVKDDTANSGETPDYIPEWLQKWFDGETEQDDWDARETHNAEEHESQDPAEIARRRNEAWQKRNAKQIAYIRRMQKENEQRKARGLPPLPVADPGFVQ